MEHHERLLVFTVDDEPGIRLGVEAILRGFTLKLRDMDRTVDFAIRSFETGEAFLEALETETPALVLLDCKLPGIGGLEILEQVLSAREDIVTLIVTAYATLETAVKTTKMGAFDFLAKPFTPDELRYTVRKAATHVLLRRERHRLETERRQIRFQFISVLAHELKSPINAVEGYLDLMVNGLLGQELDAYGPMVEKCISRIGGMRKLIADLMDLTRLESGQHKREIQTVDLRQVAELALEGVELTAQKRGITLGIEGEEHLILSADPSEMEIVFNNLVSNAVKYNRDQGQVRVSLTHDGADAVRISVMDTGLGMEPEDCARLFNEFVRIKNDETRNIPGSGLGLSIVKKLAHLYGGEVSVTSVPGEGSTFTVVLRCTGSESVSKPMGCVTPR